MKKLIFLFLVAFILSGCVSTAAAVAPTETAVPAQVPAGVQIDLSGIAQDQVLETVTVPTPTPGGMILDATPRYRLITLKGYPVTGHKFTPLIYIYPVADMAGFNEVAAQAPVDLKIVLQDQVTLATMPFLPLINAKQGMHPLVKFLDFKNGKGVRFLTQFNQAPIMINNQQLIYTYQGLTGDGKYYIAAVLPVTHPDLPATAKIYSEQMDKLKEFPAYLDKTIAWLDQQPASAFTPDLSELDALVQSIEVH